MANDLLGAEKQNYNGINMIGGYEVCAPSPGYSQRHSFGKPE
jgi:hypothetical protein